MTVALVAFIVVVTFAIIVEDKVSFVCRVDVGLDWFVSFRIIVAFVTVVPFDIIFFVR